MLELMEEDFGWITMARMLTFKRLSEMSRDPKVILTAIAKSNSGLMQVGKK